jgi:predicted acyl esterase
MTRRCLTTILAVMLVAPPFFHGSAQAQQLLPCDFGSTGDYSGSYAKVSRQGPYEISEQEIVEIESGVDGVTIQIGLFRPKVPSGTKVPVIADASPYYHPLQTMDLRACRPFLTENFISHGYAVALVAIRGTADSGGCMNLMGPDERADLDQAITWLGKQGWSNGSVGMIGLSYDGATQWEVASFGNQYLKTIVPASGVPDLFELMYGQKRVDWRAPGILNGIYYAESAGFYAPGRSPEHTVEVTACPEYGEGMAASAYSSATGELDPFGYYEERLYRPDIVKNYRGSIYLVQGLQDWNVNPGQQYPWIWKLEKQGVYVKHLLGQWGHSWPYGGGNRMDWADILLEWFDRWLKNDRGARLGPKFEVQDSSQRWRSASKWPAGKSETYWLNPDGQLSSKPSKETSSEMVATDPFHTQGGYDTGMPPGGFETTCAPGTCASFETEEFKEEFHFAGLPELDLRVVPMGPGGQLAAYLYALSPDGAQRLGWGQLDLRFRDGSYKPQEVTPGEGIKARLVFQPLDAVVPEGSTLVLIVGGGTAYNRLPNAPNYPVEILAGDRKTSLELIHETPNKQSFFKPKDPGD